MQDVLAAGGPSYTGLVMPYLLSVSPTSSLGVPLSFAFNAPSSVPFNQNGLPGSSGSGALGHTQPPPPPSPPCELLLSPQTEQFVVH